MKICIPVAEDRGLESQVCSRFGSAPRFMIVDTNDGAWRVVLNRNSHHVPGICAPLASLEGEQIDAVAVGGIGASALKQLIEANIRVYGCGDKTVARILADFRSGMLILMQPSICCHHQGRSHSCRSQSKGC